VALDRCVFAVRLSDPTVHERLSRRAAALARFYGPLGARGVSLRDAGETLVVGSIRLDGGRDTPDATPAFGEPLPPSLRSPGTLLAADAGRLRELAGSVVAVDAHGDQACVVAGAGAPSTIYTASSAAAEAWSSHGVAAAWLARGQVRVDPAAIPELLALEFVGGERTLVDGVRALPPATRVALGRGPSRTVSYWPARERWLPVEEGRAYAVAEDALLRTLDRRVAASEQPFCSLTGGLDSRVTLLALDELGARPRAFTWGESTWPDVASAAEVAAAADARHQWQPIEWLDDRGALAEARRQVRFNEGLGLLGPGRLTWPAGMTAFITGGGGELGRSFYYRGLTGPAEPDPGELARRLMDRLGGRIAGAGRPARDTLQVRLREWVEQAQEAGARGWGTLDVLYGEQRLARWLRGMLPCLPAAMVPAFATPEVGRALVSLPLAERLEDGFHRRFIAARRPELVPAGPRARPGPSRPSRSPLARVAARLPLELQPVGGPSATLGPRWPAIPEFRQWVAEGVLGHAMVAEAMGRRWAAATRRRFLRGDAHAEELALWAAGPVALSEVLAELREPASAPPAAGSPPG
jgi:hypothetical protein